MEYIVGLPATRRQACHCGEAQDLLVNRIRAEEELALILDVLLNVLVAQAVQIEHKPHSDHKGACPQAQQLQLAI